MPWLFQQKLEVAEEGKRGYHAVTLWLAVLCGETLTNAQGLRPKSATGSTAPLTFTNVTAAASIATEPSGTHGASIADVDGDGFPDIYVCSQEDYKIPHRGYKGNYLFKNNGNGTFSRVEVPAGYCIQNEPVLHFGLGLRNLADLRARFPNGTTLDIPGIAAGEFLRVGDVGGDTLHVLEDVGAPASTGNSVLVEMVNTSTIGALQFVLTETPHFLMPVGVNVTPRAQGFSASIDTTGKVRIYSTTGATISPGSGPVAEVIYSLSSAVNVSEIALQLSNARLSNSQGETIVPVPAVGAVFRVSYSLPVGLPSFQATADGGWVRLRWTTATETSHQGFYIERSRGTLEFSTVSFVPGAGTTATAQEYGYVDGPLLAGRYSYRLRQVDADGPLIYSPVVEVMVLPPTSFALKQSFPNALLASAFNSEARIVYELAKRSRVEVVLYDLLGRRVKSLADEEQEAGTYQVVWDGRDGGGRRVTSGIYLFTLRAGNFGSVKKLVVIE